MEYLFAGVPVADYGTARQWYERLFGRPPDLIPNDSESAWQLTDTGWILGQLGLERHGARTLPGLCARVGLRLLSLAAGLRHNAEIGQPGRCFSAYGH